MMAQFRKIYTDIRITFSNRGNHAMMGPSNSLFIFRVEKISLLLFLGEWALLPLALVGQKREEGKRKSART